MNIANIKARLLGGKWFYGSSASQLVIHNEVQNDLFKGCLG